MATRYVHLITPAGVECWRLRRGEPETAVRFSPDSRGVDALSIWLSRNSEGRHIIVADLPDETYEQAQIPALSRRDRKALIARRLAQSFPDTPYSRAISVSSREAGKREEHFILAGINHPQHLDTWLKPMQQSGIAISEILSPALLCSQILRAGKDLPDNGILLLISESSHRHVCFKHRQPCFTRQIQSRTSPHELPAETIVTEIMRSIQYLHDKRLVNRGATIPVLLVCEAETAQTLLPVLATEPGLAPRHLRPAQQPTHLPNGPAPAQQEVSRILIQAATAHKKGPQFAPAVIRRRYKSIRLFEVAGCCALMAICALAGCGYWLHLKTEELRLQADLLTHALENQKAELRAQENRLPPPISDPVSLQQIGTLDRTLKSQIMLPAFSLDLLSQSLDRFPDLVTDSLDWVIEGLPGDNGSPETGIRLAIDLAPPNALQKPLPQSLLKDFLADLRTQGFDIQPNAAQAESSPRNTQSPHTRSEHLPRRLSLSLRSNAEPRP